MRTAFRKSFERNIKKLSRDPQMLGRVLDVVGQVEAAGALNELPSVKKLAGGVGNYYRIRVGDYRIGLELEDDLVVFVVCLNRREIYREFP